MAKLARYIFSVDVDGSVVARRVTLVKEYPDFDDVEYQTLPATRLPHWVQEAVAALGVIAKGEIAKKRKGAV